MGTPGFPVGFEPLDLRVNFLVVLRIRVGKWTVIRKGGGPVSLIVYHLTARNGLDDGKMRFSKDAWNRN